MKTFVEARCCSVNSEPLIEKFSEESNRECEDDMKDMTIKYSDFCKDSLVLFPVRKLTLPVHPSRDILSDDYDPK